MSFADMLTKERERLLAERVSLIEKQKEIEIQVLNINKELTAIDAYEAAKTGKATVAKRAKAPRIGSVRTSVLDLIKQHPEGLKRGDIIEKLHLKDKEQSVSNVLSTLKASAAISAENGLYKAL